MRLSRYAWLVLAMLLLVACATPVPPDKLAYVGEWQAPEMYLLITADGSVRYRRINKGATTSVEGPIKAFVGDDFEVGIGFFTTTFVVNRPPWQDEDGRWLMVVDEVRVVRNEE